MAGFSTILAAMTTAQTLQQAGIMRIVLATIAALAASNLLLVILIAKSRKQKAE